MKKWSLKVKFVWKENINKTIVLFLTSKFNESFGIKCLNVMFSDGQQVLVKGGSLKHFYFSCQGDERNRGGLRLLFKPWSCCHENKTNKQTPQMVYSIKTHCCSGSARFTWVHVWDKDSVSRDDDSRPCRTEHVFQNHSSRSTRTVPSPGSLILNGLTNKMSESPEESSVPMGSSALFKIASWDGILRSRNFFPTACINNTR